MKKKKKNTNTHLRKEIENKNEKKIVEIRKIIWEKI